MRAGSRAISVPLVPAGNAPERAGFSTEFRAGIRFFAASRILVAVAVGIVIAMLGLGAVNSLAVFFVPRNLHVGAKWLGALTSWPPSCLWRWRACWPARCCADSTR